MKKHLNLFLSASSIFLVLSGSAQLNKNIQTSGFIENKGQLSDQNGNARPDILFSSSAGGLAYHLRASGISYQLSKVARWKKEKELIINSLNPVDKMVPDEISVYRLDLEWLNVNPSKIETEDALPGWSNYYLSVCPDGVRNVKTYSGLTYKNIYDNIDLHYYHQHENLKYDYLVAPYADYSKIRIRVKGTNGIVLQDDGSMLFKTPLGNIKEEAPRVYQNKKQIKARWILKGEELSFFISVHNPALPLIIDPMVRSWGTYYGGSDVDEGKGCATDVNGNVFMTGRSKSTSNIATTGAYQAALSGSDYDAFLVKLNDQGIRQWATYYGGTGEEAGNSCATDLAGNCYVAGKTSGSNSGIASPGTAHQGFSGGGFDAMLVKFDNLGARVWGTYYGGSGLDQGLGITVDGTNLYMSGYTMSAPGGFPANPIATPGSHQTAVGNGFLVKFTTAGVRQWGTYYGGPTYAPGNAVSVDGSGNVYMVGLTMETTNIATPGAHQTAFVGLYDGYLVKFNSAGVRQWGTYYGDISLENISSCATDAFGNIYFAGLAASPTGISTPGTFQPVIGMALNGDGMLVKFNSAGVRQWGTYYGGNTDDAVGACAIAPSGDIYIAGITNSPAGIATADGIQTSLVSQDAFFARMTPTGQRVWGTYYGGAGLETALGCAADANGHIYMSGYCGSATIIATPGSHQSVFGGGTSDGFLVQFFECIAPANPVNTTSATNASLCSGSSATLNATGTGTLNWYNSITGASLGTGSSFVTPTLSAGTTTFYAAATNSCAASSAFTSITVTVVPGPATHISSSNPGVCPGGTLALTATGASQYTWSTNSNASVITVTPSSTTGYTVNGSANGCSAPSTITVTVYASPTVSITAPINPVCIGATATLTATGANQYTWTSGPVSAAMVISPQTSTSYSVTGTSVNGCTVMASVAVTVRVCTGIDESEKISATIFPNPFKESLSIQTPDVLNVKVINIIGQILKEEKIDPGTTQLNLAAYPNGVYLIKLVDGNDVKFVKVVKD